MRTKHAGFIALLAVAALCSAHRAQAAPIANMGGSFFVPAGSGTIMPLQNGTISTPGPVAGWTVTNLFVDLTSFVTPVGPVTLDQTNPASNPTLTISDGVGDTATFNINNPGELHSHAPEGGDLHTHHFLPLLSQTGVNSFGNIGDPWFLDVAIGQVAFSNGQYTSPNGGNVVSFNMFNTVPEPSDLALWGTGFLALAGWRLRRRRQSSTL